ncbi:MAG: PAS domain S-box protein, partial [Desulfobacterales bacterium]|nr:PAS domain S-box protein [Desulfobacterales bacterium]
GKKCFEVYHKRKEPCKPYPCLTLKSFQDGKIHKHDTQVIDSNGKIWYFHCTANVALRDKDGKPVAVIEISKDITERKQTEEALCKSEEKYRMLYDSSTDAIMLATPEEGFLSGNTAAIKIFGCKDEKEFTSQTPHNLSPLYQPDGTLSSVKVKRMMAIAMKKGSHFFEWTHKRMDGQEFYATVLLTRMELQGKRMLQAIVRDITKRKRAEEERKKLEDRLSQTQKMEAIGVLAGGIAHDFNNILTPVLGFTELALFDVPAGSKTHKNLNEVLNAGQRAKNLVKQILTFSRQSEEKQREPIRTSLIIKEVLKLLQAVIPSTIEIRQNIAPDTHVVNADPTKIHQILMNLCSNAGHAMPEGGVLEISLVNVDLDEKICAELEDLTAGSYIRLTVKDTGCGMDKKTLTRIFDPFFTTKAPGEGTGLGLSVVHGIVKSHGGNIVVQSKPGIGTTFHIYLPVAELIAKAQPETTEQFRGGTESILFIDDEAMIVDMFAMILKQFGYRVTTRSSGVEALELFRFKPDEFDLVITDQTMPKLTGSDLALELLRIRPDIPIILCTGFSHTITPEKARAMGIRAFVMKPVVGTELGRTIRQVLD